MNTVQPVLPRSLVALLGGCIFATASLHAQCLTTGGSAYTQSYGVGCGSPTVLSATAPVLGTVANVTTSGLPASSYVVATVVNLTYDPVGFGTMFTGFLTLPSGCVSYIPEAYFATLIGLPVAGQSSWLLPVPNDSGFTGFVLHMQSVVLGSGPVEVSNALCLHCGT